MKTLIKNIVFLLLTVTTFCHAQEEKNVFVYFNKSDTTTYKVVSGLPNKQGKLEIFYYKKYDKEETERNIKFTIYGFGSFVYKKGDESYFVEDYTKYKFLEIPQYNQMSFHYKYFIPERGNQVYIMEVSDDKKARIYKVEPPSSAYGH